MSLADPIYSEAVAIELRERGEKIQVFWYSTDADDSDLAELELLVREGSMNIWVRGTSVTGLKPRTLVTFDTWGASTVFIRTVAVSGDATAAKIYAARV